MTSKTAENCSIKTAGITKSTEECNERAENRHLGSNYQKQHFKLCHRKVGLSLPTYIKFTIYLRKTRHNALTLRDYTAVYVINEINHI